MKLIDTSAWVEFLRGTDSSTDHKVHQLIDSGQAAWCELVILELLNGGKSQEESQVRRLRKSVWIMEMDGGVWHIARNLVVNARRSGLTVPLTDTIVAACARSYDLEIEQHGDAHFEMLSNISV